MVEDIIIEVEIYWRQLNITYIELIQPRESSLSAISIDFDFQKKFRRLLTKLIKNGKFNE